MDHHIYRVIELVGSSQKSIEDAINMAIERANATIRNLRWFEVVRTSGQIEDGQSQAFPGDAEGRLHDGRRALIRQARATRAACARPGRGEDSLPRHPMVRR